MLHQSVVNSESLSLNFVNLPNTVNWFSKNTPFDPQCKFDNQVVKWAMILQYIAKFVMHGPLGQGMMLFAGSMR